MSLMWEVGEIINVVRFVVHVGDTRSIACLFWSVENLVGSSVRTLVMSTWEPWSGGGGGTTNRVASQLGCGNPEGQSGRVRKYNQQGYGSPGQSDVGKVINMTKVNKWCKDNKMAINCDKTKVMLITTYQKEAKLDSTQCHMG